MTDILNSGDEVSWLVTRLSKYLWILKVNIFNLSIYNDLVLFLGMDDMSNSNVWPCLFFILQANPAYLKDSRIVLPVQINGKTRGTIHVEETCTEEEAFDLASRDEKLSKFLDGNPVKKRIYVPGKILNIVLDRKAVKVGVQ